MAQYLAHKGEGPGKDKNQLTQSPQLISFVPLELSCSISLSYLGWQPFILLHQVTIENKALCQALVIQCEQNRHSPHPHRTYSLQGKVGNELVTAVKAVRQLAFFIDSPLKENEEVMYLAQPMQKSPLQSLL